MNWKRLIFCVAALLATINLSAQILKGSAPIVFAEKADMDAFTPSLMYGSELAYVLADTTLYRWSRDADAWTKLTTSKVYVIATASDTSTIASPYEGDFAYVDTTLMFLRSPVAWLQFYGVGGSSTSPPRIWYVSGQNFQLADCETSKSIPLTFYILDDTVINTAGITFEIDASPASITYDQFDHDSTFAVIQSTNALTEGVKSVEFTYTDFGGESITWFDVVNVDGAPCYTDTLTNYPDRTELADSTSAVRGDMLTGTGASGLVAYWNGTKSFGSNSNFTFSSEILSVRNGGSNTTNIRFGRGGGLYYVNLEAGTNGFKITPGAAYIPLIQNEFATGSWTYGTMNTITLKETNVNVQSGFRVLRNSTPIFSAGYYGDSHNHVGIGTLSPAYRLDIQGTDAAVRLNPATAPINAAGVAYYSSSDSWFHGMNGTSDFPFAKAATATFTAGSVLFAGTSGQVQQDNTNLFWNNTNKTLGIGTPTTTAGYGLQVETGAIFRDSPGTGTIQLLSSGGSGRIHASGDMVLTSGSGFDLDGTSSGNFRLDVGREVTLRSGSTSDSNASINIGFSSDFYYRIISNNPRQRLRGPVSFYNSSANLLTVVDASTTPNSVRFMFTDAIKLPIGTTAQRPPVTVGSFGSEGSLRENLDSLALEYMADSSWHTIADRDFVRSIVSGSVSGTGTTNKLAYWSGANTLTANNIDVGTNSLTIANSDWTNVINEFGMTLTDSDLPLYTKIEPGFMRFSSDVSGTLSYIIDLDQDLGYGFYYTDFPDATELTMMSIKRAAGVSSASIRVKSTELWSGTNQGSDLYFWNSAASTASGSALSLRGNQDIYFDKYPGAKGDTASYLAGIQPDGKIVAVEIPERAYGSLKETGTTSLSAPASFTKITGLEAGVSEGVTLTDSTITVSEAGDYRIRFNFSVAIDAGGGSWQVQLKVYQQNVALAQCLGETLVVTSGAELWKQTLSGEALVTAAASDVFDIRYTATSGATYTLQPGSFTVEKL